LVAAVTHEPPLIVHVIHHLYMGGMENGLVNLINHMPADKFRHAVLCVEDYSDFRSRITRADVEVIALNRSRVGIGKLRREIFRLCRALKPAIVHTRNLSGLDALLPARLAGVAHCVHGEHGWDVHDLEGKRWRPIILRRLHAPLIEQYITVSRDLQRYLLARIGIRAARITQIYNGVDTDRFQPAAGKPRTWLPPAFQDASLTLIGTVGRVQPVKDQATLLQAFAQLITREPALRPTLRLLVVGDGPLLAELKTLAATLNIADITCYPGAMNDVPQVLRALDVFVLPSLNEGISNTILEAMACGLPVIATGVGGNLELVADGACGRFFTPRDAGTLCDLLLQYTRDVPLREAHSRAARHHAVEQFGLATMVARYQAVYDQLLGRAPA
jgi:sugar transferase (PEP-CTERM/EpsH1 system associated)